MAHRAARARRTVFAALLTLALDCSPSTPGHARPTRFHGSLLPASGVVVRADGGDLTIAAPALGVALRAGGTPLRLAIFGAGGRPLPAPTLAFTLDPAALARLLPGRHLGAAPIAVQPRRLLRWQALPDGASLVAATDDPLGRTARITVRLAARGVVEIAARLDDARAVIASAFAADSGADEHFFGLGEQFGGVDQRCRRVGILVQDGMSTIRPLGSYAPVPFFLSTRGYGFYLAGTRPSRFALDAPPETGVWRATTRSAALDAYVLDGPLPPDALARYVDLTGHPPMPPPWTLGVWKTAIGGQARVLAEARRLRAAHIPVSAIWSYDAVDESVKLGWPYPNFARIPPGPYPDLPAFTAALHREGYRALGYLAPEFTPSRPGFAYPARRGYFVRGSGGRISLLDLTNPAALAWWEGAERRILTTLGFDGWLLDLGDRLPPSARFWNGQGADEMANRYPLLLAAAAADVARAVKPDALFVMRSGFSGTQALQPAVWPGDQRADWSAAQGLPAAISAGLSWGLSGEPFWGSDIGGYLDGAIPPAQQEELWTRWLAFGALSPIMRDQLGNKGYGAVYLWSNARTQAAFRRQAQLHQSLFPYLYAAARTAHLTGMPIMRHLFLAYPHDPRVYALNDEYLLGADLLVAPVIAPGVASRRVYLPAGAWIDYWTGVQIAGGRTVVAAAPLDHIPLFVRGGALLPTLTDPGDTLAPTTDPAVRRAGADLALRLYPGGPGEAITLADGTRLDAAQDAGGMQLRIVGPARGYTLSLPLARAPRAVWIDGRPVPIGARGAATWRYDEPARLLRIQFHPAGGSATIRVAP